MYINDLELFFSKIKTHLKSDGRFIFSTVNPHSWRFFLKRMYHKFKDEKYYNYRSLDDINAIVSSFDLKIDSIEGFYWLPFKLSSNNPFVKLFVSIERLLKLKNFISQSPWLMISIKNK